MKKGILTSLLVLQILLVTAQVKTDGVSAPPHLVNLSDKNAVDYFPSLINLTQHPLPAAEYGYKKEALNKLRDEFEATHTFTAEKKSRGTAVNPTIVKTFQGNIANGVPNDNDIAVSNAGIVVSVVNSNMRIFDDTGKTLANRSLTSIFAPVGNFTWISDPRVLYDPNADRFVLVCFSGALSTSSTILVAFTQSNDPAGVWNCYTLNGASFNDSTWSDYPIIALSDKDLFMTFNQVKDNVSWTIGFKQSVIWQISKQEGYNAQPLQYTLWSDIKYNGGYLRNICPAKYQTTTIGNNMYFLTLRNVANTNDSIFVTEITDSKVSGNAQITQRLLIAPTPYGFPPNARQKKLGSNPRQYLMTNDARVLAAVYENDYVHFGSNTINLTYMNAGVYLGTIKNISTANPIIKGDIFSSASMEYGYPSMAYLGQNHKLMYTFSHCIVDSFPGTSVMYKNELEEYSDILSIKNGLSTINVLTDSNERWGDYTNIQKLYNAPNRTYLSGSWGASNQMNCWIGIVDNIDFPASVSNLSASLNSTVFPNPTQTKRFTTRFTLSESQMVYFILYDMQGKRIQKILHNYTTAGEHEFSFSVDALSSGQYLLNIEGEKGMLDSHKVVVGK